MEDRRGTWLRVPALVVSVIGLIALMLAIASSGAGADPGNGNGNACVTQGDDTDTPPAGCDSSRPGGHSQGKVCPENHPQGKRVPAVDKGLSPNRPHGNAAGGTEVVCATQTLEEPTTTTTPATTTTTVAVAGAGGAAPTQVLGVTVTAPETQGAQGVQGAQAAPKELAFTGPLTAPGLLAATGLSVMGLGAALFLLESRVPASRRARR